LSFIPRIAEARSLARKFNLLAMIDLSDGLATDLRHLCKASGVGAELFTDKIPVHPQSQGLEGAFCDGEDYELLFALSPEQAEKLSGRQIEGTPVSHIGKITEGSEIILIEATGRRQPLTATGWEHAG